MRHKVCTSCHKELPLTAFHRKSSAADKCCAACTDCRNLLERIRYAANPRAKIDQVKLYRSRNPLRYQARSLATTAIKNGTLVRQPCQYRGCNKMNTDAHHDDYTQPLKVRWLCRQHHKEWHLKHKL